MLHSTNVWFLCLMLFLSGACAAPRDSAALVQDGSLLSRVDRMYDYVDEAREILDEVQSLHRRSLEKATSTDGDVNWIEYLILMLLGGGGLYSERRRAARERDRLHSRLDKRKGETSELRADLDALRSGRS